MNQPSPNQAVKPRSQPANDNLEKLPNNGWWMVGVFVFGVLAMLAIIVSRAQL